MFHYILFSLRGLPVKRDILHLPTALSYRYPRPVPQHFLCSSSVHGTTQLSTGSCRSRSDRRSPTTLYRTRSQGASLQLQLQISAGLEPRYQLQRQEGKVSTSIPRDESRLHSIGKAVSQASFKSPSIRKKQPLHLYHPARETPPVPSDRREHLHLRCTMPSYASLSARRSAIFLNAQSRRIPITTSASSTATSARALSLRITGM